jgi:hypothetical protein
VFNFWSFSWNSSTDGRSLAGNSDFRPARHPHPGKMDGEGSGAEARSAGMAQVEAIVTLMLLVGAPAGLWYAWRRWLQACPHCGGVVRRLNYGWLRCPRCHR